MLTTLLIFLILLAFIFLGFPIFMALLITGIIFLLFGGNSMQLSIIKMFGSINSLSLMAIPFFVTAGNIILKSKITNKLVKFADSAVGWMPGGLGHVNVLTSMIFGGIQGSGCADAAAIGGMLIPAMEEQGYDKDYAVAVTAGSSMLSPIIPPSICMILYSYYTEIPVGRMFMGGLVPGILIGLMMMGVVYLEYKHRNYDIPRTKFSIKNLAVTFYHSIGALIMPLIILSGICFGIVTPTESGVLAILYGLFYGFFITKSLKIKDIPGILVESAITTAVVYMTIVGAGVLSNVLVRLHFQSEIQAFAINVLGSKFFVVCFMFVVFIILGMFLDPTVIIAMFASTVLAIGNSFGFDPVHFGVIMTIIMQLGAITPPVGTFLFISCGVAKLPMEKSIKPLLPYIFVVFIGMILCFLVPGIVTGLPNLIYG
ncbi:TRAP transporter large permease [Bullifex sp.]|uniref:TRAP transporter large permease n=1 Tax=Bullifex sp. TaxID=2815808 RepID=UPI002A7F7B48|nr:TRAP transporter large permease [Bullifex sp.]MDY4067784.1 TRAP transporter large permease [Bullifex sp.]